MSFIFLKNAQIELTTDCVHAGPTWCARVSLLKVHRWRVQRTPHLLSAVSHDNPHLLLFPQKHHSPELCMRQHKQSDQCLMCYRVWERPDWANGRTLLLKQHVLLSVRDRRKDPEQLKGSCSVFPSSVQMFHDIIHTDAAHAHLLHRWWLYMEKSDAKVP